MSAPSLKYYSEFQKILTDYQISEHAKDAIRDLKLVLLMAATSTGRSVIVKKLSDSGSYHYIVSDTTRPPQVRDGRLEQDGVQYYFRSEEDVLKDLRAGNFLEAEIIHEQQVSGISIRELEKARNSGKIAFTEADIAGVMNIKRIKPDTTAIFLLPPSFAEWQRRIAGRGGLSADEIDRRLRTAVRFLEQAPKLGYFQFVIAGDPDQTAKLIDNIARGQVDPQQDEGRRLAGELLDELLHFLKQRS